VFVSRGLLALVFAWAAGLAAPLEAAAQPAEGGGWDQFQADAAHTGFVANAPAPPYAPTWTVRPDAAWGRTLSAPVVAGDTVVVAAPNALLAFDLSGGSKRWSVARDGAAVVPAVAATGEGPIVVYTDGRGPDDATVKAVDLASGEPAWGAPPALRDESKTGVTVDGTRAFVGDESGRLSAIDVADGTPAWAEPVGTLTGPVAAGDGIVAAVVAASDANRSTTVVAFDAETGDRRWSVTPDAAASFGSLPSITDGAVVVAFPDGSVLGLSTDDGSELWSQRIPALVSPFVAPALADESVFLADSNGGLHRITPGDGASWLFAFNEAVLRASPVVAGDAAVVGFEDGSIGAVALDTGHMVFRSSASNVPVRGIALTTDALVVVRSGTAGPAIVAFGADPAGTLVDVQSPTIPVPGDLALGLALALLVSAAIFLPGRLVWRTHPLRDPSEPEADEDDETSIEGRR
jgi:outer membrane protein assembly factor BamB